MKAKLSRVWRNGLAMLLAICMIVGFVPAVAFATEESAEKPIYYVSLGDSTTNGYGLTGYEFEEDGLLDWVKSTYAGYDGESTVENPNGLLMETPGAYPAKFRDYLADATGREVNLIQLAISAMRADDVLQLLTYGTDDYYKLDDYSGNKDNSKYVVHNKFLDDYKLPFEWNYDLNDTLGSMAELYQNSVKAADVGSINLGSNNFSIYLWSFRGPMLTEFMAGNTPNVEGVPTLDELLKTVDPALVPVVNDVYAKVKAMMMSKLGNMLPTADLADACATIADCAVYTFLSYCVSYTRILDRVNELNKDADIILMPMVNFMKGFTIDLGNGQFIDMSDYIAYMLNAANTYVSSMAAVKTENTGLSNKVFYADHGGKVDMLMAEMPVLAEKDFEGAEVLHSRLISSLTGWIMDLSGGAFNLNAVRKITREDVQAYKEESFTLASPEDYAHVANVGAYVGIETALINAAQNEAIKVEFFKSILDGSLMDGMVDLFTNVGGTVEATAMAGNFFEIGDAVAALMDTNETAQGLLYFMAYFMVADGVVCHPSESGYTTIANAMKKAYEEEITAKDEALDNIKWALEQLMKVIEQYVADAEQEQLQGSYINVEVSENFKYVALGDGTAEADGYAEKVAEFLNEEAEKNGITKDIRFVNAAKAGNTVASVAANLSADAADADLITLGFSQTEMMGKALKIVMADEKVDWAALLGAEAVPYVEEALAKVNAEVDAAIENAEVATLVKAVLEAYAYGAVEYAINVPALLYAIRAVNKEAIVINVGMYNPLDGVTVAGFDLSQFNDYFNYLIDGVAVYGIGLAMVTNQIDYVDARDVEVAKANLAMTDLLKLTQGDVSALYPSAAGDTYIANQIAKALNLSFAGLLGDVDGNGVVNGFDLLRLKKYLAGENVEIVAGNSDTTMDGAINGFDALRLQKYLAGAIESL